MIFFRSEKHKIRFLEAMNQIDKIYNGTLDPEYAAAVYIFAANLSTWNKVEGYVTRYGINIETMLEEIDFSGGESVLVQWAGNLFNQTTHIDPIELLRLDKSNFEIAMTSLKLRRDGAHADDFKEAARIKAD